MRGEKRNPELFMSRHCYAKNTWSNYALLFIYGRKLRLSHAAGQQRKPHARWPQNRLGFPGVGNCNRMGSGNGSMNGSVNG